MKLAFVESAGTPNRLAASVVVEIADPALEERIAAAIGALTLPEAPRYPAVVLRGADLAAPGELAGKIAIVPVRRARSLAEEVARVRDAGPLGIQLVFDDRAFDVARATRFRTAIFAVLEAARGGRGCPLFLARTRRPSLALRLAISQKGALP